MIFYSYNLELCLQQVVVTHSVTRRRNSRIFQKIFSQKTLLFLALRYGRTFPRKKIPCTHFY
jgi:hypothetical protein